MAGPMAGAIVETAVVSELMKAYLHRGERPILSFWRTATVVEVDVLAEQADAGGRRLVPLEVRYLGDRRLPLGDRVTALPLAEP
ncbi:MAG TPA: DUF4143 domain-containing protein [Thermoleophilia bacterium]|nr:DUF4143 domain-containing protein [Thermoleophilia bacterium]